MTVDGDVVGSIGAGLCVLLGVARDDTDDDAIALAGKVARLRVFSNNEGRFDKSLLDTDGRALVVSQFTLIAETDRGNRPSFSRAAEPALAEELYERFIVELRTLGIVVATGRFGAAMTVTIANEGPVTLVIDR